VPLALGAMVDAGAAGEWHGVRPLGLNGGSLKFFTAEWHAGKLPDAEADRIPIEYESHIGALLPSLPSDALRLIHEISLHDGLIRRVERRFDVFEMVVRAGDQQAGYFDARVLYDGAEMAPPDEAFLESAVGRPEVELLYDEFDSGATGSWIHRILFWPYREVSVQFKALELRVTAASGRFSEGAA
jgi:hypothetical protein